MWKPVYNMKYPSCERRFMRRDLHIYGKGRGTMKNRVRELRTEAGMTQQQLADLVHVSSRTIISLEKEQYNPSLLLAYRIAELFGVTVEDLYCLKENRELEDRQYEDLQ